MRLLLRLDPQNELPYDNDYHYHLQGLVYSLIRGGGREDIHDRAGYKFFCFSNIFPYREKFTPGSEQQILISSPDPAIMSSISRSVRVSYRENIQLKVGRMSYKISGVEGPFSLEFEPHTIVKTISSTPIVIRIPKWRYNDYGIVSERPFENWRDKLPLEAFVKQLRDNMEKKLKDYGPNNPAFGDGVWPEIVSYRYLRSASKPITVKGEKQQVIGSIWEFEFAVQDEIARRKLEFILDCGFGERNSIGFGFMNQARNINM